jgi:hypothetical protein
MKLVALSILLALHCLYSFSRFTKIALKLGYESVSLPLDIQLELGMALLLGLVGVMGSANFRSFAVPDKEQSA